MKVLPPKVSLRLLEYFCPPQLLESIEGDLVEQFYADVETAGAATARRRFTWNVIRFFRFEIIARNRFTIKLINTIMVGNYFKVALRNIKKRKLYSFINAFGLSIGIAFCMLIWLFIQDELSFDQFHANKDVIYRIDAKTYNYWDPNKPDNERWSKQPWLQIGFLGAVKDECPEVVGGTRFTSEGSIVTYKDNVFKETFHYVDADFLKMFSFRMIKGNETALSNQFDVVITNPIAEKFFGTEDPIGKTLLIDIQGVKSFNVTGVIESPPANSSLEFNILIRQENRPRYDLQMTRWGNFTTPTFVQVLPGTDTALFNRKLNNIRDKYMAEIIQRRRAEGNTPEDMEMIRYSASPFSKIHLMTDVGWHKRSDKQYSYILGGIALLILLIASINYISLALTTSAARRTEVGIRKVVGALSKQLTYQFAFESIILAMISLVVGLGLVVMFLPWFNEFTEKAIALDSSSWISLGLTGIALAIIVGVLAGSYPAMFLARFRPVAVLKGGHTTRLQAGFTRPLIVLQFAMSAFLIVSSVIMYRQMKFISTKDLGYNKDAVVVVPMQTAWDPSAERALNQLKNELNTWSEVDEIAGTDMAFNDGYSINGYKYNDVNHSAYVWTVDPNYVTTLGLKLVAGRNFDPRIAADSMAIIVNESLMKDLGLSDIEDAYINWTGDTTGRGSKVIGVVKDYNFISLEHAIEPMLLTMNVSNGHLQTALVRVSTTDVPSMISKLETTWHRLFPDKPFQYSFLDENVAKQYDKYEKRMSIMGFSTLFAILISCLGLFGLAGVNAINKTKEIGIRKVLGAGVGSIFVLLNRQYIWLSLIAFALAMPFSWYMMDKWLAGFQYHIAMGWELFMLSVLAGLLVALLTVSYHAIRVSSINPADTLKHE